jgi:hypothetical protein
MNSGRKGPIPCRGCAQKIAFTTDLH